MFEDKLTSQQRRKLECVAQSVAFNSISHSSIEKIISDAKKIEDYLQGRDEE